MKIILLVLISFTTLAFAKVNFSIGTASNMFDDLEWDDEVTTIGVRGDFYLDQLYHIDLGYENLGSYEFSNLSQSTDIQRFYTQFTSDGEEEYSIVPSVGFIAGYELTSDDISEFKSQPYLGLGLGFRYNFVNNFNILLDGKALWKTDTKNVNYNIGLNAGYMFDTDSVNNKNQIETKKEELIIPKHKLTLDRKKQPKINTQHTTINKIFPPKKVNMYPINNHPNIYMQQKDINTVQYAQKKRYSKTRTPQKYIQLASTKKVPTKLIKKLRNFGFNAKAKKYQGNIKTIIGPFKSNVEAKKTLWKVRRVVKGAFIKVF
jgi:hypothetical protein